MEICIVTMETYIYEYHHCRVESGEGLLIFILHLENVFGTNEHTREPFNYDYKLLLIKHTYTHLSV